MNSALVSLLIEHGADVNKGGAHGWTPLMAALFYQHPKVADVLLEHGASVSPVNDQGMTAEDIARWRGENDILPRLRISSAASSPSPSQLFGAVQAGNHELVKALLAHEAHPDAVDSDGRPLLFYAVLAHDPQTIRALLDAGAPPDQPDRSGTTPLMIAAFWDQVEAARILTDAGADPTRSNKAGTNAFTAAQRSGSAAILSLLKLKSPAAAVSSLTVALIEAVARRDVQKAHGVLDSGASVDGGQVHGRTVRPLVLAAFQGDMAMMALLTFAGAKLDISDERGTTPLLAAIAGDHHEAADWLVGMGADATFRSPSGISATNFARQRGWRRLGEKSLIAPEAFAQAIAESDLTTVRELLKTRPELARLKDSSYSGWTPLGLAAKAGSLEIAESLIREGADLNDESPGGLSPLHVAVSNGNIDIVRLLIRSGASLQVKDDGGRTPEMLATSLGFNALASILETAWRSHTHRINAGLAALGYLDRADDVWDARHESALQEFVQAFPQANRRYATTEEAVDHIVRSTARVCNGTAAPLYYALATARPDRRALRGWYPLQPGRCTWVSANPWGDGPPGSIYIYAEAGGFPHPHKDWQGTYVWCVPDSGKAFNVTDPQNSGRCRPGTKSVGFLYYGEQANAPPLVFR